MITSVRQMLSLLLVTGTLVGILVFVITGSRPKRQGKPTHARRWSYLARYHATGLAARIAVGIPFGWAVGEIALEVNRTVGEALVASLVLSWLVWTIAPALEIVVGSAAMLIQVVHFATASERTGLLASGFLFGVLAAAGLVAGALGLKVGVVPLALAVALEIAVLAIELGGSSALVDTRQVITNSLLIAGAVVVVGTAPRLGLALLGVAVTFAEITAFLLIGPSALPDLLISLVAIAGVVPAAVLTRFRAVPSPA